MHSNLQLTPTLESNNQISFLDILIIRKSHQLEIDVHRNPTTSDTTINYLSNHPKDHKLAAYRDYIKRKLNLPLDRTRQIREWQTLLHIATSNNFPTTLLHQPKQQIQHRIAKPPQPQTQKTTQNGQPLASLRRTCEKSPTYSSTQTSKSVSDAATQ
jgi:hypothetical protein